MIFVEYIERERSMPWKFSASSAARIGPAATASLPISAAPCGWHRRRITCAGGRSPRSSGWMNGRSTSVRTRAASTSPSSPTGKALHFQRCGLYDEIIGHGEVPSGLHLVEFFAAPGQSAGEIKHWFGERAGDSGAGRLTYVINRLGLIAPDPAAWPSGPSRTMRAQSRSCVTRRQPGRSSSPPPDSTGILARTFPRPEPTPPQPASASGQR